MTRINVPSRKLIVVLLLILTACASPAKPTTEKPQLIYTVDECNEDIPLDQLDDWAEIDITVKGGEIRIHHNLAYVCCAEINVDMEKESKVIKLVETNVGDYCECMCGYEIEAKIAGLPPGHYIVQVWGVKYQDLEKPNLLGDAQIDL
jgi:hypothetical protein